MPAVTAYRAVLLNLPKPEERPVISVPLADNRPSSAASSSSGVSVTDGSRALDEASAIVTRGLKASG